MSAIWKFELGTIPDSFVEMPEGAEPLHLCVQRNVACLWAKVDPGRQREIRHFEHVGTGHAFEVEGRQYVGTYQLDLPGGLFVGHVYERVADASS